MQILYWLLAIVLLGVLITIHELGHFLSARALGIQVMEFAIGMGPKIWKHKGKDGVLYSLRALPLGGFCMFYGEDQDKGDDMRAYNKQKVWKRFVSVLCGPAMNFVAAILVLFVLYGIVGFAINIPQVESVSPGTAAEAAGLMAGDKLMEVNGVPVGTVNDMIGQIGANSATILVDRGGERLTFTMQPRFDEVEKRYMIGIYFAKGTLRLGVGEAAKEAVASTGRILAEMARFFRGLFFKGEGTANLVGPIGTLNMVQQQTQEGGIRAYLQLAALISVNLGFFNLLPIPGLDGSRLIFMLVEAIRRKPMDPNKEGFVHLIGFALLMGVAAILVFRDIKQLFA